MKFISQYFIDKRFVDTDDQRQHPNKTATTFTDYIWAPLPALIHSQHQPLLHQPNTRAHTHYILTLINHIITR